MGGLALELPRLSGHVDTVFQTRVLLLVEQLSPWCHACKRPPDRRLVLPGRNTARV
jgi:hypothetical protein